MYTGTKHVLSLGALVVFVATVPAAAVKSATVAMATDAARVVATTASIAQDAVVIKAASKPSRAVAPFTTAKNVAVAVNAAAVKPVASATASDLVRVVARARASVARDAELASAASKAPWTSLVFPAAKNALVAVAGVPADALQAGAA